MCYCSVFDLELLPPAVAGWDCHGRSLHGWSLWPPGTPEEGTAEAQCFQQQRGGWASPLWILWVIAGRYSIIPNFSLSSHIFPTDGHVYMVYYIHMYIYIYVCKYVYINTYSLNLLFAYLSIYHRSESYSYLFNLIYVFLRFFIELLVDVCKTRIQFTLTCNKGYVCT